MLKSVDEVWCICLDILQDVLDRKHLNMWIKPIKPIELNENVLVVLLPGQIFYDHIEAHYAGSLKQALRRVIGEDARLEYRIKADSDTDYCKSTEFLHVAPAPEALKTDSGLNPDYLFETFITGKNNIDARLAAAVVAQTPGAAAHNPFVINGQPGLGKAHLAHAIGNDIECTSPQLKVLQVSASEFIRQFDEYHIHGAIQDFTLFYRSLDVLIMIDIQFLAYSDGAQEAFLEIFNHLHRSAKQIVFTSDKAPRDLKGVDIRLWSRLQWGLSAEINLPDYDTRLKIIRSKIQSQAVVISEEVISDLAGNVTSSVRELEGALAAMLVRASLHNQNLYFGLIKKVLRDVI